VRLLGDDQVISMSILRRAGTSSEEREAYLRSPRWRDNVGAEGLTEERYAEIADKEQFLLTVTENGFGKRSSTYEYRRTKRGGQGITNIVTSDRNGGVVASFPVKPGEQLMLVTDQAKVIRTTVGDIRIAGRNTQGVTIFKIGANEKVVSVAKIDESEEVEIEIEGGEESAPDSGADTADDLAAGPDDGQ
jgi:DNA gyrase subunit A